MRKYLLFQDHVLSNLILKIMGKLLFPVCRSWNWSSAKWNSLLQITLLVISGLCNSKVLILLSLFLYNFVSCIYTSPLFFPHHLSFLLSFLIIILNPLLLFYFLRLHRTIILDLLFQLAAFLILLFNVFKSLSFVISIY